MSCTPCYFCTNGQYSQQQHLNIAPVCSADDKGPGDDGKTKRTMTHVIDMAELTGGCQPGYWLTHVTVTIHATTENYHNGTDRTASLAFEVNEAVPNVTIDRPVYEERFVTNEHVTFKAQIYAPSQVDGSELKWYSDKDGELGQGLEIHVNGLSLGNHEIKVVGYDQQETTQVRVLSDLWELYRTPLSRAEIDRVLSEFTIEYVDGDEEDEKWENFDTYEFDQTSPDPSKIVAIGKIDLLRHRHFTEPLPFTGKSMYDFLRDHVNNIRLKLNKGENATGGGSTVSLHRDYSIWHLDWNGSPNTILIHEARHCEPDDPGHVTCNGLSNMDQSIDGNGASGHARNALFKMWFYKYSLFERQVNKDQCKWDAKSLLESRFCTTPQHSNPLVQAIIDEL